VRHQLAYLGVAYLVIWAGIAGYLLYLGRRQRAVERRLNELQHPDGGTHDQAEDGADRAFRGRRGPRIDAREPPL
jgi:CcmD family protein